LLGGLFSREKIGGVFYFYKTFSAGVFTPGGLGRSTPTGGGWCPKIGLDPQSWGAVSARLSVIGSRSLACYTVDSWGQRHCPANKESENLKIFTYLFAIAMPFKIGLTGS
jgi:hypothetical protein